MTKRHDSIQPYGPFVLRMGLAVVFLYHGYDKVFGVNSGLGSSWSPNAMPIALQVLVAWGELLAGMAFFFGFLTNLAAVGIIAIMVGAILTVHGKNGFGLMQGGYEYNFVLIMMSVSLLASGPGIFSVKE